MHVERHEKATRQHIGSFPWWICVELAVFQTASQETGVQKDGEKQKVDRIVPGNIYRLALSYGGAPAFVTKGIRKSEETTML